MKKKENPFLNILLNIIIPVTILIKFSSEEYLGPVLGLIVAISFPIAYGVYDFAYRKDYNILSIFGFASILLTGGISLLELNPFWIIIKETSIPLLIALMILIFKEKSFRFIKELFLEVLDEKKIKDKLSNKNKNFLDKELKNSTKYIALTFLFSALLNFLLAFFLIQSQPGTEQYNIEIGKMTALSFPLIALPSTILLIFIFIRLFNKIKKETKLKFEEMIKA